MSHTPKLTAGIVAVFAVAFTWACAEQGRRGGSCTGWLGCAR